MKTIIAGSRLITTQQEEEILDTLNSFTLWKITEVVCGMAKGVDILGKVWAENRDITVIRFYPKWDVYGPKTAPIIRNHNMAVYADCLLAFWNGTSPGTKSMIQIAKHLNMPTKIYMI